MIWLPGGEISRWMDGWMAAERLPLGFSFWPGLRVGDEMTRWEGGLFSTDGWLGGRVGGW